MIPIVSIFFMIVLPAFALYRNGRNLPLKRPYIYSCGSFAFCAWGIIFQIITIKNRLYSGDIGGIEDTIKAVILISIMMLLIALLLNIFLLGISYERD